MRHTLRLVHLPVVLLALGALILTGCSTSGSSVPASTAPDPISSTTPAAGSGSAGPSGFPSGSAPTASPTGSSSSATSGTLDLSAALLDSSDVPGYTGKPDTQPGSPLPCTPSLPSLETTFKPQQKGEVAFDNAANTISFAESIAVYDESRATQAAATAVTGFSCTTGDFGNGLKGRIVPVATAVPAGADTEKRWDVAFSDGTAGTLILVREGGDLLGFTFQATKATDELDPAKVVAAALDKLDAAR